MLRNLHVKNMALIREIDVEFSDGLSIMTGETGAGKSIIIGSLQLALGQKLPREMNKDETSLVEVVFENDNPDVTGLLEDWGIDTEDGIIVISRKIDHGRSAFRINGSSVTAAQIRACTGNLIEIHGQHENQKLLNNESQLLLVDEFGGRKLEEAKEQVKEAYARYRALLKKSREGLMDESERERRLDFLQFQIREIEEASLREGEDEELELQYKKLSHVRHLTETLNEIHAGCAYEGESAAGERIGSSLRALENLTKYDSDLDEMAEALRTIDELLNDFNRDLSSYLSQLDDDPEILSRTEERLDNINRLKSKYGSSVSKILLSLEDKKKELGELEAYADRRQELDEELGKACQELEKAEDELTELRKEASGRFAREASAQLQDLNFARADFEISFSEKSTDSENGRDVIEFLIATNPGEPLLPLRKVASGGELSRIMLGIRTMFASRDKTGTLIFDEIDTGISGRTAQRVAEKLAVVGREHQTICITHLPQIAAMADHHYAIIKEVAGGVSETTIRQLGEDETVKELARLTGGAEITDSTLASAREMKNMSNKIKNGGSKE